MNQWAFVVAAYAVTFVATVSIVVQSAAAMRRAERDAEAVKDRR